MTKKNTFNWFKREYHPNILEILEIRKESDRVLGSREGESSSTWDLKRKAYGLIDEILYDLPPCEYERVIKEMVEELKISIKYYKKFCKEQDTDCRDNAANWGTYLQQQM